MSGIFLKEVNPVLSVYKILCIGALIIQVLVFACVPSFGDYGQMCFISLVQLALFVAIALASPCRQPFCILFLVANWIFNCGQIACIAAGHADALNLDFRWYGSQETIASAFRFYLYSQTFIAAGAILFQKLSVAGSSRVISSFGANAKGVARCLIIIGLPFWLYVNISKILGAAADAYRGVYSLIIPAPIQAAAFFFEAGLFMMLLIIGRERKGTVLFWSVAALKVAIMATGGRQDSVCFLAIWCLLYFWYLRRLTIAQGVTMAFSVLILMFAVDAFGELRTGGFSFEALFDYLAKANLLDVIWDSLGEFGCAFSTLVVSMANVPDGLNYGMGASYLAGILSVVPMLVSNFPSLKAATLFTASLPGTSFLGGSMLGEFYFNFGWFGIVGAFFVGAAVAWCQNRFNEADGAKRGVYIWAAAVLAMFLLLFIRGYFTDAMMKIVYVFLFAWVASGLIRRFSKREKRDVAPATKVVLP